MTIYFTPFLPGPPPVVIGPSYDSGLTNMNEVRMMFGEPLQTVGDGGALVYDNGDGTQNLVSSVRWSV